MAITIRSQLRPGRSTFSVFRNPAIGGLARGLFCIIGRIKVTLWLAALVAAVNMAAIARWAQRTGIVSDDDALAPPVGPDHGFEELDDSARLSGTDPPATVTPN